MMSGGVLRNFREGWALNIFGGGVAHYFQRYGFDTGRSRCGVVAPVRWLYGCGDFPLCRNCQRATARAASAPA